MTSTERGPREMIIKRLNFDAAQSAEYEEKIEEHKSTLMANREKLQNERLQLNTLLKSGDKEKADSIISVMSGLHQEMDRSFFNHFLAIKNICNAEQLKEYDALIDDLKDLFPRPARGNQNRRNQRR